MFTRVKVHRDFHVEVARALYSVPEAHLGRFLDARADRELVKLYSVSGPAGAGGGRLVKTHPPSHRAGGPPTQRICPNTRPATRCGT